MSGNTNENFESTIINFYGDFHKFDHSKLLTSTFGNILNSTPVLIPVFSLIQGILFNDSRGGLFFAGSILNTFINYVLQIFTKNKKDNPICMIYKKMNTSGMPSIHAQTVGFLGGFLLTMMYIKNNFRLLGFIFIFLFSIGICLIRYKIECNSIGQILVGLILGGFIGSLWAWIVAPSWTPWGSESDVNYQRFEQDCDKKNENEDYECKAYQNGRIIETSY